MIRSFVDTLGFKKPMTALYTSTIGTSKPMTSNVIVRNAPIVKDTKRQTNTTKQSLNHTLHRDPIK
jgi:hypothetical protein